MTTARQSDDGAQQDLAALLGIDTTELDRLLAKVEAAAPPAGPVAEETELGEVLLDLPEPARAVGEELELSLHDEAPADPGALEPTTTSVVVVQDHLIDPVGPGAPAPESALLAPSRPLAAEPFTPPVEIERRPQPEAASMLTADRLIESKKRRRPAPEGGVNELLYKASLHAVNLGDSAKVRERKALDARIGRPLPGGTRFVPVLTRKGGVGKTTVTALLGMALASVREDRVIAIDANPDRGTLSERVNTRTQATVRDVVVQAPQLTGFTQFSTMVSRDDTRLDVLASDTDPLLAEAFDDDDYNVVARLCERFYSLVLTDCGTGIVHSVMRPVLDRADGVVIVSGGSVDEARLASETLTWLEANGHEELARNAVVALNTATQGTQLVKLDEIEQHFASRVRAVVRIPYDPLLAAGAVIEFAQLKPLTRESARELAALVVDGLPEERRHR